MRASLSLLLASSLFLSLPASPATAGEPVTDAAIADVVETRDGLVVRGTILERDPSGSVILRSATGALRTFKMSEVVYAGPASRWSQPVTPPTTREPAPPVEATPRARAVEGETVPVELEAPNGDITFHLRNATAYAGNVAALGYTPLCSAPCKAVLPRGVVHLGVAEGNGLPRESSEVLRIDGPSRVRAEFPSAIGRRLLGGALALGGFAVATLGPVAAMKEEQKCDASGFCRSVSSTDTSMLTLTILGGSLLAGVGAYMVFAPSSVKLTVTPLSVSPVPGLTPDARRVFAPSGAALEVSF